MIKLPFIKRPEQSLTEANEKEIRDAIQRLVDLSTHDYGYYLFLVLSIFITSAGLLLESYPVIIGGMIIAPLLTPLLGCGLGLLLIEAKGFLRALTILVLSSLLAIALSAGVTVLTIAFESAVVSIDYVPTAIPPGLYLIIAISSGVAGAFAFVKSHLSSSLSGVAVSASLLPPLCAIGIGIALRNVSLVESSAIIFLINVGGIIAASAIVFWTLGFRRARKLEAKVVEKAEG
jgi:uncharacterized hydrophobic protein (TIGR00271 family)